MRTQSWTAMFAICMILMAAVASSSKEDDKILSLPGQPQVGFQQYSGYITIDETQQRALFYYFVEAETDPASKPLVLWLNGGPGCSSVGAGAFSEHGPFQPSSEDSLVRNEYSWNKEANILYLESPAGVGFSYSANTSFYDNVNDTITAQDNVVFLQQWFAKFPEYMNRDFFITGESYAGHYVPQLANLIFQSGLKFNLKGIAIGNPLMEFDTDLNSQGDYYWSHGLISDYTFELLISVCNISELNREYNSGTISSSCKLVAEQLTAEIPDGIDGYDVTSDVCPLYLQTSKLFKSYKDEASESIDLCVEEKTFKYLNKKEVQEALHAKLIGVPQWFFCSEVMNYDYNNLEIPTIDIVGSLVSSGLRVLIYSGDQDSVIPFIGSRALVNGLAKKLNLNTTTSYRGWLQDDKQVGGWTEVYGDILTYATIRGASHMAPWSSPKRSLALFKAFVAGTPLI
ncbi:serine carboxypeptidase-like 45 [Mercurialis annua]|uniref:serine carboxypeptidase-like 45 n=1 Tax=Mercurialis annua TaxID=3986 RepID=UPI0024ADD93F|nr:serine carboxypeptidase-like 45 [Mercurialis annua]